MTSAVTATTTRKAFPVYSILSEPTSLIRIITSMLLPILSSSIIPTSPPIAASAAASTFTSALAPASVPVLVVQPPALFLNSSRAAAEATAAATTAATVTAATAAAATSAAALADYYTVPQGTLMRAVVNINIDLESLPFNDPSLNVISSFSLSQYHQMFQDITGISISESANYLMEGFYHYYNIYDSYDITIEDQEKDEDMGQDDVRDDEEVGLIVDIHDKLNIPVPATTEDKDEDEIFADSYHEEINWFVEIEGGRKTQLISIMHVDLGSDIPHLMGELRAASNALESTILLQKVLHRDLSQQQQHLSMHVEVEVIQ